MDAWSILDLGYGYSSALRPCDKGGLTNNCRHEKAQSKLGCVALSISRLM